MLFGSRHDDIKSENDGLLTRRPLSTPSQRPDDSDPAQRLASNVLRIRRHAAFVDSLFMQVDGLLLDVLSMPRLTLQPRLKAVIREINKDWGTLDHDYRDVLWRSRELAGVAQAIAADFTEVCVPRLRDQAIPVAKKIGELREYEQASPKHTSEAAEFDVSVTTLLRTVKLIGQRWYDISSQQKWRTSKDVYISTLLQQITASLGPLPELSNRERSAEVLVFLGPVFSSRAQEIPYEAGSPMEAQGLIAELSAVAHLAAAIHRDIDAVTSRFQQSVSQESRTSVVDQLVVVYEPLMHALRQYQVAVI